MADKAAKADSPGDEANSGKDQATAAGPAKSRASAGQQDTAAVGDDPQPKFREALERKHQAHNDGQGRNGRDGSKINGAHGPAASRRNFRRKSG